MRGLWDGMELEKMKSDVNRLRVELGQVILPGPNLRFHKLQGRRGRDEDDEDEL